MATQPLDSIRIAGPLVLLRVPPRVNRATLDATFAEFDSVLTRGTRFASVIDLTVATVPGAAERQVIAHWLERIRPLQRLYNVASAHVVPSAIVRGAITAIHWIVPPPSPQGFFGELDEAFAYAFTHLETAGIEVSTDARALRMLARR